MATFSAILLSVLALVTAAHEIQTLQDLSNTLLLNQLAMSNMPGGPNSHKSSLASGRAWGVELPEPHQPGINQVSRGTWVWWKLQTMLAERDSGTRVIREWLNDLQSNITSEIAALQNVGDPQDAGVVECVAPFVDVYGHCILVETALTGTWETMRRHCQQKGGEIVKVDCGNFMYYLVRYLHSNGLAKLDYWVGGRDEGHEGSFFWTDGTQVKMGTPFWGDGITDNIQEPDGGTNQNCIVMATEDHYFFFDDSCNISYAVICEKLKLS